MEAYPSSPPADTTCNTSHHYPPQHGTRTKFTDTNDILGIRKQRTPTTLLSKSPYEDAECGYSNRNGGNNGWNAVAKKN
jgi:hypothetical protein